MRSTPLIAAAILLLFMSFDSVSAEKEISDHVRAEVIGGRYMSSSADCTVSKNEYLNWKWKEFIRCVYSVTDNYRDGTSKKKKGVVYLANPSPEKVLVWLNFACGKAAPTARTECIRASAIKIRKASGAQFPIAGIVWEDQYCNSPLGKCKQTQNAESDGVFEAYLFRNGVTVRADKFLTAGSISMTEDEMEFFSTSAPISGMKNTGGYARIISTTREQFSKYSGRSDIPLSRGDKDAAEKWSSVVGEEYRKALLSDENILITATVCHQYGWPKSCK